MSYVTGGHTVELQKSQAKPSSLGVSRRHQWDRNRSLAGDPRTAPQKRPHTIRLSRFCPLVDGLARDSEPLGDLC
jgi:hypothetical protein